MLDHHHGIGAARNDAAGGDRGCGAGCNLDGGRDAASDHLGIEHEPFRRGIAGANRIRGTHGKTIDIGTVEWRRIDRRDHVGREYAGEHRGKGQGFGAKRRAVDAGFEAPARFRGRNHFEELLLARGAAHGVENRRAAVLALGI